MVLNDVGDPKTMEFLSRYSLSKTKETHGKL